MESEEEDLSTTRPALLRATSLSLSMEGNLTTKPALVRATPPALELEDEEPNGEEWNGSEEFDGKRCSAIESDDYDVGTVDKCIKDDKSEVTGEYAYWLINKSM